MKLISWNVNGLESRIAEDFLTQFDTFDADFFCLQNTDLRQDQLHLDLPGYQQFWCWADDRCSGLAVFTKYEPRSVQIGDSSILLEYPEFCLCNGTPDSLPAGKPLIACCCDAPGLTDSLKLLRPNAQAAGFRVSEDLKESVYGASPHSGVTEPGPVSLDIDLPCNGSILSPTSLGKASVISRESPQEPPAESTTEETPVPNSIKVPKKWILAASTALVLLLCAILLWPSTPKKKSPVDIPEDLVPIQITELKNIPICPDYLHVSVTLPDDTQGSSMMIVEYLTNDSAAPDGPLRIYTDPFVIAELDQATFCTQVQLTEEALELAENGWKLSTSILTLSSSLSAPIEHLNLVPYYSDESRDSMLGWFLFGEIYENSGMYLKVSHNNSDYEYEKYASFVPTYTVTTPDQAFIPDYCISCPYMDQDDPRMPTGERYAEVACLDLDGIFYTHIDSLDYLPQSAHYWIYVKADETLLKQAKHGLTFQVSRLEVSGGDSFFKYTQPYCFPVFSDPEKTQTVGWLVFSDNPYVTALVFTLSWYNQGERVSQETVYRFPTYINTEQAVSMTTEQLIQAILGNQKLCDNIPASLNDTLPNTPICQELASRPDAVSQLMNWDISTLDTEYRKVPYAILRCLRDQMTPEEEAKYLLGDYPNSPYSFDYENLLEVDGNTEGIVELLSEDSLLWMYLSFGDDAEVQRQIYLRLRQRCGLLLVLEQCDDAAEVMLEHIRVCESETCQMNLLYNMWDWIQTQT